MSVIKHPLWNKYKPQWIVQRDCFEGEFQIKMKGFDYLPLPSGKAFQYLKKKNQIDNWYEGFKAAADFPEILEDAVDYMKGLLFQDSGNIELPARLRYLFGHASPSGDKLATVERNIAGHQLVTGRCFALWVVDVAANKLRLVLYDALSIFDWHTDSNGCLTAIVLDESAYAFEENKWVMKNKYRVCGFADGKYYNIIVDDTSEFDFETPPANAVYENLHKIYYTKGIPGLIINAVDMHVNPSAPVTIRISEACLKAYINSARLEAGLDVHAQPTLYTINAKVAAGTDFVLGASVELNVDNSESNPEIGILETSGTSFAAMTTNMNNHKQEARRNIELIEQGAEAGVALNTRLVVKTASLQNVALNLQDAMTRLLGIAADWMGDDKSKIEVHVHTDFRQDELLSQDLLNLASLVNQGLMTKKDMFYNLKKAKKTQSETYEEWASATEEFGLISGLNVGSLADGNEDG